MVKIETEIIKKVIEKYKDGIVCMEIANELGITHRTVYNILRRNNIKKNRNKNQKYKINEHFFKTWSNEMAYILGFILTDGCINKRQYHYCLTISQKENTILEKIKFSIGSNHPVYKPSSNKSVYELRIGNKTIVNDLINLGITVKKSFTVEMPPVPSKFLPDFIRGVIDGDGCIRKLCNNVVICSGSESFANSLNEIFLSWNLNSRINRYNGKYFYITISTLESMIKLHRIIYYDISDSNLFLERKKNLLDLKLKKII